MGEAQFWSPQRILAAKTFQETKEAAEQEEKRQKTIRKEQAACEQWIKQAEQQERTIQRQLRQQAAKEERETQKAERQAVREQKRLQRGQEKQEKAALALQHKEKAQQRKMTAVAIKKGELSIGSLKAFTPKAPTVFRKAPVARTKIQIAKQGPKQTNKQPIQAEISTGDELVDVAAGEVKITSRRGRAIKTPQRFQI